MNLIEKINSRKTSTYIFAAIAVVFILILIFRELANNPSTRSLQMAQKREQKDLQFKNDPKDSPIKKEDRADFKGLKYFGINEDYVVPAILEPDASPDTLMLMTTKGEDYAVVSAGAFSFELQGRQHKLTAYRYLDPAKQFYFVPFKDLTSGVSTYGGGRYLDVPIQTEWILDFNDAYNPYCVYNETYSCPLPPRENKLQIEVRAGELNYK